MLACGPAAKSQFVIVIDEKKTKKSGNIYEEQFVESVERRPIFGKSGNQECKMGLPHFWRKTFGTSFWSKCFEDNYFVYEMIE
jgi:hypothetical protein